MFLLRYILVYLANHSFLELSLKNSEVQNTKKTRVKNEGQEDLERDKTETSKAAHLSPTMRLQSSATQSTTTPASVTVSVTEKHGESGS